MIARVDCRGAVFSGPVHATVALAPAFAESVDRACDAVLLAIAVVVTFAVGFLTIWALA